VGLLLPLDARSKGRRRFFFLCLHRLPLLKRCRLAHNFPCVGGAVAQWPPSPLSPLFLPIKTGEEKKNEREEGKKKKKRETKRKKRKEKENKERRNREENEKQRGEREEERKTGQHHQPLRATVPQPPRTALLPPPQSPEAP